METKDATKIIGTVVIGGIVYKAAKKLIESEQFTEAVIKLGSAIKKNLSENMKDLDRFASTAEEKAKKHLAEAIEKRKRKW